MNVEAMTWPRWLPRVLWMGRRCPRCDCVQFKPAELRFFDGVRRQNSIRPKLHLLLTARETNSELIFGVNGGVSRRLRTDVDDRESQFNGRHRWASTISQ